MKFKKVLSLVLVSALAGSLVGCSGSTTSSTTTGTDTTADNSKTESAATETAATTEADTDTAEIDLSDIIPDETVTLNVYSQLANYEGEQIGWFAQIMKDKFNVKLNIISNGDGVFDTRMESGDLGDIVLFGSDGEEYTRAYSNGMLLDWNEDDILSDYGPHIVEYMQEALDKNQEISGGTVYGFGHDVASSAGQYADFDYHPDVRYDLYKAVGSPEINDLMDWVDVLKAMKEAEPASDSGKETYGVSLFKDWDGNMMMFAKATATNFYGLDEFYFGFYDAATGEFEDCLKEGGHYEECLRFYNKLYQEGLLDPDSMTQGYDGCMEDYQDGSAFWCIFSWMGAAQYNTQEHLDAGKKMLPVAAKNQNTLVYGLNPTGSNRVWTIGANTQYPELCMAIIDYLATPEGRLEYEYGPKDVCWEYLDDGSVELTDFGLQCKELGNPEEMEMPAPYSGLWKDGCPQMNNTTWSLNTVIPGNDKGQTFNFKYWDKYLSLDVDATEQQWRDDMGVDSYRDYMSQFKYTISKPHTYAESIKSDELSTVWEQVKMCVQNGSWQAVYAKDDAEFDSVMEQMRADADSYGYQDCVEWCTNEAALRKAAEID